MNPTGIGPAGPSRSPQATPTGAASTATGGAIPDPDVNLADAEQVCAAFAAALYTVVADDDSPRNRYRRAAAYATSELATSLVGEQGRLPVPQQHPTPGGVAVTGYVGDHIRPDTDGVGHRAVLVTLTRNDGTTGRHVVYCTLRQDAGRWLVAGYEQERSLP